MEVGEDEEEIEETVYFDQSVDEVDNFIVVSTLVSKFLNFTNSFLSACLNLIFTYSFNLNLFKVSGYIQISYTVLGTF